MRYYCLLSLLLLENLESSQRLTPILSLSSFYFYFFLPSGAAAMIAVAETIPLGAAAEIIQAPRPAHPSLAVASSSSSSPCSLSFEAAEEAEEAETVLLLLALILLHLVGSAAAAASSSSSSSPCSLSFETAEEAETVLLLLALNLLHLLGSAAAAASFSFFFLLARRTAKADNIRGSEASALHQTSIAKHLTFKVANNNAVGSTSSSRTKDPEKIPSCLQ